MSDEPVTYTNHLSARELIELELAETQEVIQIALEAAATHLKVEHAKPRRPHNPNCVVCIRSSLELQKATLLLCRAAYHLGANPSNMISRRVAARRLSKSRL